MKFYLAKRKIGWFLLVLLFTILLCAHLLRTAKSKIQYNNSPIKLYEQYRKVFIDPDCKVKAKISGIYHLPGDSFYNRIVPDECFSSAKEAEKAGFRPTKQ